MALIKDNTAPIFDREQIAKGDLIRAKHSTWDEARNGVVVSVTDSKVVVFYWLGYGNVTNHFVMLASEVSRKEWTASWTSDMVTIKQEAPEPEEPEEGNGE